MYAIVLTLHNLMRWAVLIVGFYALYVMYTGWFRHRSWTDADRRVGSIFAGVLGFQFLLGILLYLLPGSMANYAIGNFANALRDPNMRFFITEHSVVMFVAVVLGNVTPAIARRATTDERRFRRSALLYTLTLIMILLAIPWPFLSHPRPWFRLG